MLMTGKKTADMELSAVVTVDARGQLVLPAEIRRRLGLKGGEKFALIPCGSAACPSALTLIRVDELGKALQGILGPLLRSVGGPR